MGTGARGRLISLTRNPSANSRPAAIDSRDRSPPDRDQPQRQVGDGEGRGRDVEASRPRELVEVGGREEGDRRDGGRGRVDAPGERGTEQDQADRGERVEDPPDDQGIDPERDRGGDDDGRPHRGVREEVAAEHVLRPLPLDHAVADPEVLGLVEGHAERVDDGKGDQEDRRRGDHEDDRQRHWGPDRHDR